LLKSNRAAVLANVDLGYKIICFKFNWKKRMEFSFPKENNSFLLSSAGVSFIPTVAFEG
jgi:hypothetical protein